jgi:uncharacterized 2Fe-2S/4Fe-4S cluster protein (DUF4445 family)
MPTITFQPSGKSIDVPEGATLIDAARLAEASLEAPCGGRGTCGGCAVRLVSGTVDQSLSASLPTHTLEEGQVLACHSKVKDRDVTVYVPEFHALENGPTPAASDDALLIDKTIFFSDSKPLAPGGYGVAIDLGTTTAAVKLIHLTDGKTLSSFVDYNSQVKCGSDVMSRMEYARKPSGLRELKRRALNTLNGLIEAAAKEAGIPQDQITSAVVAGNPTMIHLLLGKDPNYLRTNTDPADIANLDSKAGEIGLAIASGAPVVFPPAVGNYVGGDVTAGMLCTQLARPTGKLQLLIDIGTNGEVVVGDGGFFMACACSAGPAFEGGGLTHGMRAAPGAVDKVEVDPQTGHATFTTIGGEKPRGLCGSGVLTLLAELFENGFLNAGGKFNREKNSPYIKALGRRAKYVIAPEAETALGEDLTLSETDIESVLRAKAAIFSACSLLLEKIGASFEDLECLTIAGGFGRTLDFEKAVTLGLLPDVSRNKFRYIGNSSLTGASMLLTSAGARNKLKEMIPLIQYLDLIAECSYFDHYTAALFIPHTDLRLFPSAGPNIRRS